MMVESIILPRIGEKSRFCFVLCSLIRTSEQCSKVLPFDNKNKKNPFLFCIVLTYSYLCTRSPAHTSVEGRCDFCG